MLLDEIQEEKVEEVHDLQEEDLLPSLELKKTLTFTNTKKSKTLPGMLSGHLLEELGEVEHVTKYV